MADEVVEANPPFESTSVIQDLTNRPQAVPTNQYPYRHTEELATQEVTLHSHQSQWNYDTRASDQHTTQSQKQNYNDSLSFNNQAAEPVYSQALCNHSFQTYLLQNVNISNEKLYGPTEKSVSLEELKKKSKYSSGLEYFSIIVHDYRISPESNGFNWMLYEPSSII